MNDKYYNLNKYFGEKYTKIRNGKYSDSNYTYELEDDMKAWLINNYYQDKETEEEKEVRLSKEKIEFREKRLSHILDK